ncbi:MAG: hypothetical protein WDN76_07425 [Alphaproteobacteria bacterium]
MLRLATINLIAADLQAFEAYEKKVLLLLEKHRGRLEARVRALDGSRETHLVFYPDQQSYSAYLSDPVRQAARVVDGEHINLVCSYAIGDYIGRIANRELSRCIDATWPPNVSQSCQAVRRGADAHDRAVGIGALFCRQPSVDSFEVSQRPRAPSNAAHGSGFEACEEVL